MSAGAKHRSLCGKYVIWEVAGVYRVMTIDEEAALSAPAGAIALPISRGYVALIDEDDEYLCAWKWHAHIGKGGKIYAKRSLPERKNRGSVYLHRAVLRVTDRRIDVDHKDDNGLDCRKKNLRAVSHSENMRNVAGARTGSRSGVLGVSLEPGTNLWRARIQKTNLGWFKTIEEAAAARVSPPKRKYSAFNPVGHIYLETSSERYVFSRLQISKRFSSSHCG